MSRLRGHYEWDDDDLTPGHRKGGGLHQNLFDSDGNLRGAARFIPDEDGVAEPLTVTETIYVTVDQHRESRDQEELRQFINVLVSVLIERGGPIAVQWWRTKAGPAFAAKRARLRERRAQRSSTTADAVAISSAGETRRQMNQRPEDRRPRMSRAEAQSRYLAALAAQAFAEEQMLLVNGSNIGGCEDVVELQRSLAEIPPDQIRTLVERMATDPALLTDDNLAQLASILGRAQGGNGVSQRGVVPILQARELN